MSDEIENVALISSAGAGKTRALTQRFLLLYLHRAQYPLDSLYGITFTNEAAFEMKIRILRYLDLLITGVARDESEQKIIEYFAHLFPDVRDRARDKKRYLLNNLSELNVSTFHSLFASFLSSIPFAAGVLPGYTVVDETEEAFIYESVLDRFFEGAGEGTHIFESISELLEQQETRIKQTINSIYWSLTPWLEFLRNLASREKDIGAKIVKQKQRFTQVLQEFKIFICENESAGYTKNGKRMNNNLLRLLGSVDEYIQTKDLSVLGISESSKSLLKRDIETKSYMQRFQSNLGAKSSDFLEIIENLKNCIKEYLQLLSDQQILMHLKPILEIHKLFQEEKQGRNVLSFDDIETHTLNALKNNPEPEYLYFKVGAEIRHLMIDEFQDTSHRQLEVIDPLISEITSVAPQDKSIFYVGDPKQAIFRWRGGTPELFYTLLQKYPGKIRREELIVNYRSKEEVVRFVNTILDKNDKAKTGNTGGWIRVEHCGDFVDKESGQQKIMERTCVLVKELHNNYGYEYSDIAVLVRTNNFGAALAEELTEKNVPCVSRSRADILSDDDVRFILNFLKFLDNPENDFALMHVLLSPIFNLKEETLRRLRYTRKTLYLDLHDSHPGWAVTKKLERLLSLVHFLNPYELIYQMYKELGIKISYPLATLLDVALDYTRDGVGYLSSFVEWVERAGESIEVKEIHPEGLKILTVHKAKGLEFEVVILPETGWQIKSCENRQLLFSYVDDGSVPDKIYWRSFGKYFSPLREAEQKRLRNDELNLLYVALTRAKNGLYILGYNHQKRGLGFWFETISKKLGSLEYSIGEVITKCAFKPTEAKKTYGAISEEHLVIKEERSLYSPTERGLEIIDSSRRRSIEFGSMIHQALSKIEWLDDVAVETFVDDVMTYIKSIYVRIPEEGDELEKRLRPLLRETLNDLHLRFLFFKDGRTVRCKNELPIYFEEEKRDVSGHIDRLLIEPDRMTIIDYKTGEEKPEYKHQMNIYKKGIQKIYPEATVKTLLVYLERESGRKIVEI